MTLYAPLRAGPNRRGAGARRSGGLSLDFSVARSLPCWELWCYCCFTLDVLSCGQTSGLPALPWSEARRQSTMRLNPVSCPPTYNGELGARGAAGRCKPLESVFMPLSASFSGLSIECLDELRRHAELGWWVLGLLIVLSVGGFF